MAFPVQDRSARSGRARRESVAALLAAAAVTCLLLAAWLLWSMFGHRSAAGPSPVDWAQILGTVLALVGGAAASWRLAVRYRRSRLSELAPAEEALAVAVDEEVRDERSLLLGTDRRSGIAANLAFGRTDVWVPLADLTPRLRLGRDRTRADQKGILDYFEQEEHRQLVILGDPGAGKTVLALGLMHQLLAQRDSRPIPIPVRFPASSWPVETLDAVDWMALELWRRYGVPIPTGRTLLERRRIVPVVDGLDELDPSDSDLVAASVGARRLNAYLERRPDHPLVLTCRTAAYRYLQERLELPGEVIVERLSPEEISRYLARSARIPEEREAWTPLEAALLRQGAEEVAEALDSPWKLTLAVTFLRDDGRVAELLRMPDETRAERRRRVGVTLINGYVAGRARLSEDRRHSASEAEQWAAFLGEYLDRQEIQGGPSSELAPHLAAGVVQAQNIGIRLYPPAMIASVLLTVALVVAAVVGGLARLFGSSAVLDLLRSWALGVAGLSWSTRLSILGALAVLCFIITRALPGPSRPAATALRRAVRSRGERAARDAVRSVVGVGELVVAAGMGAVFGLPICLPLLLLVDWSAAWHVGLFLSALNAVVFAFPLLAQPMAEEAYSRWQFDYWRYYELGRTEHFKPDMLHAPRMLSSYGSAERAPSTGAGATANWARAADDFMTWGCSIGIFRRSGAAFQFRHRELEDWWMPLYLDGQGPGRGTDSWLRELRLPVSDAATWRRARYLAMASRDESLMRFRRSHGYADQVPYLDVDESVRNAATVADDEVRALLGESATRAIQAARDLAEDLLHPRASALHMLVALADSLGAAPPRDPALPRLDIAAVRAELVRRYERLGVAMQLPGRSGVGFDRELRRVLRSCIVRARDDGHQVSGSQILDALLHSYRGRLAITSAVPDDALAGLRADLLAHESAKR